jgi:hypothetical protein
VVAAVLRLTGLAWGLRHAPDQDERPFVENAARVASEGTLDHGYFEYPGLLFYLLAPVLAFFDPESPGPPAYLAARAVVAAFGVLSVLLTFVLGRRLASPWAGLAGAGLAAVSPLGVFVPHQLRPDVVLESFCLLALITIVGARQRLRDDLAMGAAIGAATAVKFSGALLVPAYLAKRADAPSAARFMVAGGAAVLTFAALSPATFLLPRLALSGAGVQLGYHFDSAPQDWSAALHGYLERLSVYVIDWSVQGLGILGSALALLAPFVRARDWRLWLPVAVLPITILLVFSTSDVRHIRFLLPGLGASAALAGLTIDRLARRAPRLAAALALAALTAPLADSVRYVADVRQPSTLDRALDFVEQHVQDESRLMTTDFQIGLDRRRVEVLGWTGARELDELLLGSVDFLLTGPSSALDTSVLVRLGSWPPEGPAQGPPLDLFAVPPTRRASHLALPMDRVELRASEAADDLERLRDGDASTVWRAAPQHPGQWIEVRFPAPVSLARVDLDVGPRPMLHSRAVELHVASDASDWRRVRSVAARALVEEQSPASTRGQVFLVEPVPVRALRLVQRGTSERRWAIAELRLYAPADAGGAP